MQITIPHRDIEPHLQQEAQRRGTTPEAAAVAVLREKLAGNGHNGSDADGTDSPPPPPTNLAELLGDSVGCVSSKERFPQGSTLARDASRAFGEILAEERRKRL